MTDLSLNPYATAGFQAEDHMVEYFDRMIEANGLNWKVIHSVISGTSYKYETLHTITWIESAKENAELGDIRIVDCDTHGRPVDGRSVYIDVKYSKKWNYASVSFPAKTGSIKRDAVNHLCNFIGKGIAHDFWYMSIASKGTIMFNLPDVQAFVRSKTEEELRELCTESKYNGSPAWFLSFEKMVNHMPTWDLQTWIEDILYQRLG
jgi:hypothetical protein